jgi:DNA-binding FadR family transcriptional regulator
VTTPVEELVAADLEFHRQIAVGAGNPVLASLVDNMSAPTTRARIWRGMTEPRALERTLSEHRAIYDAIMRRDTDLAASWGDRAHCRDRAVAARGSRIWLTQVDWLALTSIGSG